MRSSPRFTTHAPEAAHTCGSWLFLPCWVKMSLRSRELRRQTAERQHQSVAILGKGALALSNAPSGAAGIGSNGRAALARITASTGMADLPKTRKNACAILPSSAPRSMLSSSRTSPISTCCLAVKSAFIRSVMAFRASALTLRLRCRLVAQGVHLVANGLGQGQEVQLGSKERQAAASAHLGHWAVQK